MSTKQFVIRWKATKNKNIDSFIDLINAKYIITINNCNLFEGAAPTYTSMNNGSDGLNVGIKILIHFLSDFQ